MKNTDEIPKIYPAMNAVMLEITAISKGNINQQQGFKYRSIDDCYNALNPLLAKHGIFTTPEVLGKTREERTNSKGTVLAFTCLRMKYTFWANDGSSVFCVVEGEGMDSGDKSTNKAMAVAHKYALLQTFCIPTEEIKDPDHEAHELAVKKKTQDDQDAQTEEMFSTLHYAAKQGSSALNAAFLGIPKGPKKEAVWKARGANLKALASAIDRAQEEQAQARKEAEIVQDH